ncbi:hypothetical protein Tco_0452423 [Tanacetum coccineum]
MEVNLNQEQVTYKCPLNLYTRIKPGSSFHHLIQRLSVTAGQRLEAISDEDTLLTDCMESVGDFRLMSALAGDINLLLVAFDTQLKVFPLA